MMSVEFGGLIVCVAATIYYCMPCVIREMIDCQKLTGWIPLELLAESSEYVDVGASSDREQ
jgi:hypothetical protein